MKKQRYGALTLVAITLIFFSSTLLFAQVKIASKDAASSAVEIRNVTATNDAIAGEIVNRSIYNLRNVDLLVQYHWLWSNEMHPGPLSPGQSAYLTIDREIRPGESAAFTYRPDPPLPSRSDGHYMTEVSVAGFSQVIPQSGELTQR